MSPAEWCMILKPGYIPDEDKSTVPISKFKMLKLKLQYFGHLMRTDSLGKTLILGKTEGRRRRGWQRMGWLDGSGSWYGQETLVLQSMGSQRVRHDWGMNWTVLVSGGQRIGASASASVLPMIIQDWFPLGLTGWIFLQSKGLSRVFSNTTVQKHLFFGAQLSLWSTSHIHTWLLEKP